MGTVWLTHGALPLCRGIQGPERALVKIKKKKKLPNCIFALTPWLLSPF
jgi:hypothetical protein